MKKIGVYQRGSRWMSVAIVKNIFIQIYRQKPSSAREKTEISSAGQNRQKQFGQLRGGLGRSSTRAERLGYDGDLNGVDVHFEPSFHKALLRRPAAATLGGFQRGNPSLWRILCVLSCTSKKGRAPAA
jgi:hypothetical protein